MTAETPSRAVRIDYGLVLAETEAGTGYFSCAPPEEMDDAACFEALRASPNDAFLRRHLLMRISRWGHEELASRLREIPAGDPFLRALFYEAILLYDRFASLRQHLRPEKVLRVAGATPFIHLKSFLPGDQALHSRWIALFRENLQDHRMLPPPEKAGMPAPFPEAAPSHGDPPHPGLAAVRDRLLAGELPGAPPRDRKSVG